MKLSAGTWIYFGICIFLVSVAYGWVNYSPNMTETKNRIANTEAATTEYNKDRQAKDRVKKAVARVEQAAAQWNAIALVKSPGSSVGAGGIDISENGAQLIVDSRHFRDSIQAAVNKQELSGGVTLVSGGPYITDPGQSPSTILADFYNYPAIPFPVVIFDLGTITVKGTYEQIMANVRSWANMPNYLAVSDGLRIEGTSPNLQGTYAVSLVGYIRGNKLFTTLPEVPGSSSGSGTSGPGGRSFGAPPFGPGGPGGPPAGMPAGVPGGLGRPAGMPGGVRAGG